MFFTILFLIGRSWYDAVVLTPQPPNQTGGLYLLVDRPQVQVELDLNLTDVTSAHPFVTAVVLAPVDTKVALAGFGSWAFANSDELGRRRTTVRPLRVTGWPYFDVEGQDQSRLRANLAFGVARSAHPGEKAAVQMPVILPGPIARTGGGHQRGRLAGVFASINDKSVASIERRTEHWVAPERATLEVTESTSAFTQLDFAVPPVAVDPREFRALQWVKTNDLLGTTSIGEFQWQNTDPDLVEASGRQQFFVGIAFGVWGAWLIVVAQWLVRHRPFLRSARILGWLGAPER